MRAKTNLEMQKNESMIKTKLQKVLSMQNLKSSLQNQSLPNNDHRDKNLLQDKCNQREASTEDELSKESSLLTSKPEFTKTKEFEKSKKTKRPAAGSPAKVESSLLKRKKSEEDQPEKINKIKDLPKRPAGSPTKAQSSSSSKSVKINKMKELPKKDHRAFNKKEFPFKSVENLQSSLRSDGESSHLVQKNLEIHQEKDSLKNSNVVMPKITDICDVHPIGDCNEKLQKLICTNEALKKVNQSLKAELREFKAESSKLKHSKSKLKVTVKELEGELHTVRELNVNLQKSIIEKTQERDSMMENLVSRQQNVTYSDNFSAIAALRTTDNIKRIHIGRDVWIPEKDYNMVLNNSKTPSQCASNILIKAFDINTLLKGTKTGYESNRTGPGKKECLKLDDKTFGACEDYYIYWMKNIYKPNKDQKKVYLLELTKFDYYAARKIAELKRPTRTITSAKGTKTKKLSRKELGNGSSSRNFVEIDENTVDQNSPDNSDIEEAEDPLNIHEDYNDNKDSDKEKGSNEERDNDQEEDGNEEKDSDKDEDGNEENGGSEEKDGNVEKRDEEENSDTDFEIDNEENDVTAVLKKKTAKNSDSAFDWTPPGSGTETD